MNVQAELVKVDERIAKVYTDLAQLNKYDLEARKEAEKLVSGDDSIKYQMQKELVEIIEDKISSCRKKRHDLLTQRSSIQNAQAYSKVQQKNKALASSKREILLEQLQPQITRLIALFAYSDDAPVEAVHLEELFGEARKNADQLVQRLKQKGRSV